jgi:cell surface protein SprA
MTTLSLRSALEGIGNAGNGYHSASFDRLCASLPAFRDRVQGRYPAEAAGIGATNPVDAYSADVLIPAFLNAYTTGAGGSLDIFPALTRLLPNWTLRYGGLSKLPWLRDHFKSVNLNHSYKSIYAVGSYNSYNTWQEYMNGLGFIRDATTGNPLPSSMYNVSTVSINEAFSPLLGVDVTLQNNLTCKLEFRTTRVLTLSMTSVQINEALSKDWVVGMGYKISNFNFFGLAGGGNSHKVKGKGKNGQNDEKKSTTTTSKSGVNHDLNLRLDFSLRNQASITRDIATMTSAASSGNRALKLAFNADYTLSRMLTMSFFYDQQTNTPLLSSSSYPTTTRDFGLSVKFSLTR